MILETTTPPTATLHKLGRQQNQVPKLWPELATEVQRQLAFSWAQLVVHARDGQEVEIRHDHGRYL